MIYLRVRKINIDVIPDADPFVELILERVTRADDGATIQTIGNWDRMYERASKIPIQLAGDAADDGVIDNMELFNFVATAAYIWVIHKHGGEMIDGLLVIDHGSHS